MVKDLTVILEDRPGTLAEMGEVLGAAGVNIEGLCAVTHKGEGAIHLLVNDPMAARKALAAKNIKVASERDVAVADIVDQPGALGKIARKLADAGVNVELAYLDTQTRLVLGVDDLTKADEALK